MCPFVLLWCFFQGFVTFFVDYFNALGGYVNPLYLVCHQFWCAFIIQGFFEFIDFCDFLDAGPPAELSEQQSKGVVLTLLCILQILSISDDLSLLAYPLTHLSPTLSPTTPEKGPLLYNREHS